MIVGIDYGSKLAGTTAIAWLASDRIVLEQSRKGEDADRFLEKLLAQLKPTLAAIDAPLSLPAAYFGKGQDYFYRSCDRELKAMSPMFLGGLTARAIRLRDRQEHNEQSWIEVYPRAAVDLIFPTQTWYKQDLQHAVKALAMKWKLTFEKEPTNWHQFDAVLAWMSGNRYKDGTARSFGQPSEGQIVV